MNKYEVGTHNIKKGFDCLECAERFYFELEGLKYLAFCDWGKPTKILLNTYGWKNERI